MLKLKSPLTQQGINNLAGPWRMTLPEMRTAALYPAALPPQGSSHTTRTHLVSPLSWLEAS